MPLTWNQMHAQALALNKAPKRDREREYMVRNFPRAQKRESVIRELARDAALQGEIKAAQAEARKDAIQVVIKPKPGTDRPVNPATVHFRDAEKGLTLQPRPGRLWGVRYRCHRIRRAVCLWGRHPTTAA